MLDRICDFLDWVGNTAADLFGNGDKESDVIIGTLAIVLVCLFPISLIFGIVSLLTGIGYWWFWFAIICGYLIIVLYMRIMINIRHSKKK
jgi:hypothetical protein